MTQQIRKEIKSVAGRSLGAAGVLSRSFRSIMTIVAFHRVNDALPEDGLTCRSSKFEDFCRFLARYFSVVPFSEQVAASQSGAGMGGTLSITFDDGYLDNFEVAAPILKSLRLPATFFVTTGFIGSELVPPWDRELPKQPGWMTWDHVRELSAQGFDIGCHTDTHIDLGSASPEDVRRDLAVSKGKLEKELGKEARLFAYPFGGRENICAQSLAIVREAGFLCCASCHGGVNPPTPGAYSLRRIGIGSWFDTPYQFGLELLLRRL